MTYLLLFIIGIPPQAPMPPQAPNHVTRGVQEATVSPEEAARQGRRLTYRRAREDAERYGKAVYRSDGKPGDALPKGLYELIRQDDNEIYYREVEPAGIPIPKPDRTTMRIAVEECVT